MIQVHVPVDIHTIAASGSGAFALATPLRVRDLIALAVREAIGMRAPQDKFVRSVRTTLLGLASGRYTVDINGEAFSDPDEVVVCRDIVRVRFFLPAPALPVRH